jgi:hypothetical protein
MKLNAAQVGVGPFAAKPWSMMAGRLPDGTTRITWARTAGACKLPTSATAPARYVMEFDNVGEQINSIALVHGLEQNQKCSNHCGRRKGTIAT